MKLLIKKVGDITFQQFIRKAREVEEDFKIRFDGFKYVKDRNDIISGMTSKSDWTQFTIRITKGQIKFIKKMYQLFSFKINVNKYDTQIEDNTNIPYSALIPNLKRICSEFSKTNPEWNFSVIPESFILEKSNNLACLFYYTLFFIAGHEMGEVCYSVFPNTNIEFKESKWIK